MGIAATTSLMCRRACRSLAAIPVAPQRIGCERSASGHSIRIAVISSVGAGAINHRSHDHPQRITPSRPARSPTCRPMSRKIKRSKWGWTCCAERPPTPPCPIPRQRFITDESLPPPLQPTGGVSVPSTQVARRAATQNICRSLQGRRGLKRIPVDVRFGS
jgi:hypothetical protein